MTDRKPIDWEAVEREYRAGQLSIAEIARRQGCTRGAVQKRAKRDGWTRNYTRQVREEVAARLVAPKVAPPNARDVIDEAASRGVAVIESHRRDITNLRGIAAQLAEELEAQNNGPADARDPLSDRAQTMQRLAMTADKLVRLEREAFNLDDRGDGDDHQPGGLPPAAGWIAGLLREGADRET